eukprot:jgi/Chlat1/3524/Chrsp23S03796
MEAEAAVEAAEGKDVNQEGQEHEEEMGKEVEVEFRRGGYVGDVTALRLLSLQGRAFAVLAGTGAQLRCYHLHTGQLLLSLCVEAAAVASSGTFEEGSGSCFNVAVAGEQRVRLFRLVMNAVNDNAGQSRAELVCRLPAMGHWVLAVKLLLGQLLAAGLANNSVELWDWKAGRLIRRVLCSERCMLYSLAFRHDDSGKLLVAAGTIFNEVLVWPAATSTSPWQEEFTPRHRLQGHDGSIHNLCWSHDGQCIVSVSDDRTARFWHIPKEEYEHAMPGPVLYGHTARIWDCYLAGEDCTCRVWDHQGRLLTVLQGHRGRGIWRVAFDEATASLVTAGADASIKTWSLAQWQQIASIEENSGVCKSSSAPEVFTLINMPGVNGTNESNSGNLHDSTSEYVRAVVLRDHTALYVATNQGLLHRVLLPTSTSPSSNEYWITLFDFSSFDAPDQSTFRGAPITCLQVLAGVDDDDGDYVLVGEHSGWVAALYVTRASDAHCTVERVNIWPAHDTRQLVGAFWCTELGPRHAFTADPKGRLKWWLLPDRLKDNASDAKHDKTSHLLAELKTSSSYRLLVCGDQQGNIFAFKLPASLLSPGNVTPSSQEVVQLTPTARLRGAHGTMAVTSLSVRNDTVISTGRDGCIRHYMHQDGNLQCCQTEGTDISAVERLYASDDGSNRSSIVLGFLSGDFIIQDLTDNREVVRIDCGGWRRPHDCAIDVGTSLRYCFVYYTHRQLCVQLSWSVNDGNEALTDAPGRQTSLHWSFHGMEVHSLLFAPLSLGSQAEQEQHVIVTGSEDASIRLTRCTQDAQMDSSYVLGEHVGGQSVRALAVIPTDGHNEETVLFTAGAKEILSCWVLSEASSIWLSTFVRHGGTSLGHGSSDDRRYLALTAFAKGSFGDRTLVCFIVVASSNATLTLFAFNMHEKSWKSLAALDCHTAPVLSLVHHILAKESGDGDATVVFSGSTDGSLAAWDVTEFTEQFMSGTTNGKTSSQEETITQNGVVDNSTLSMKKSADGAYRKRTSSRAKTRVAHNMYATEGPKDPLTVLKPAFFVNKLHQSGVNCASVATVSARACLLVTGGDDQAITASMVVRDSNGGFMHQLLHRVDIAHSSAVRGIWTDACCIISAGLDQRLRVWSFSEEGCALSLKESCCMVTDVPDISAMDQRSGPV